MFPFVMLLLSSEYEFINVDLNIKWININTNAWFCIAFCCYLIELHHLGWCEDV